jgi:hypothetical protein
MPGGAGRRAAARARLDAESTGGGEVAIFLTFEPFSACERRGFGHHRWVDTLAEYLLRGLASVDLQSLAAHSERSKSALLRLASYEQAF